MKNFDNHSWLPKHVEYRTFILSDKSIKWLSTWNCNVFLGRKYEIKTKQSISWDIVS